VARGHHQEGHRGKTAIRVPGLIRSRTFTPDPSRNVFSGITVPDPFTDPCPVFNKNCCFGNRGLNPGFHPNMMKCEGVNDQPNSTLKGTGSRDI
jgi:hypothetical protein